MENNQIQKRYIPLPVRKLDEKQILKHYASLGKFRGKIVEIHYCEWPGFPSAVRVVFLDKTMDVFEWQKSQDNPDFSSWMLVSENINFYFPEDSGDDEVDEVEADDEDAARVMTEEELAEDDGVEDQDADGDDDEKVPA